MLQQPRLLQPSARRLRQNRDHVRKIPVQQNRPRRVLAAPRRQRAHQIAAPRRNARRTRVRGQPPPLTVPQRPARKRCRLLRQQPTRRHQALVLAPHVPLGQAVLGPVQRRPIAGQPPVFQRDIRIMHAPEPGPRRRQPVFPILDPLPHALVPQHARAEHLSRVEATRLAQVRRQPPDRHRPVGIAQPPRRGPELGLVEIDPAHAVAPRLAPRPPQPRQRRGQRARRHQVVAVEQEHRLEVRHLIQQIANAFIARPRHAAIVQPKRAEPRVTPREPPRDGLRRAGQPATVDHQNHPVQRDLALLHQRDQRVAQDRADTIGGDKRRDATFRHLRPLPPVSHPPARR